MGSYTRLRMNIFVVYCCVLLAIGASAAEDQISASRRSLAAADLKPCLSTAKARTAYPGSQEYENARIVFQLRNRYAPAAFVFPTTVAQVQNAIACSIKAGVGIAPRGGGHSFEDYSLGGRDGVLVVDMAGFTGFSYDRTTQTAVVGAGWRLGPLYLALWNAGKVTIPAGNCVSVGIAGHALGGGWGFSSRKFGLVADNILEAQVVLANGTVVTANKSKNPDLYFALRGAGANSFGIVTQFKFQVHDVSFPVTHFKYTWTTKSQQFQNFKAFQTWGVNVPAEISASFYLDPFGNSNIEGTYLGPKSKLAPLLTTFLQNAARPASTSVEELNWIQLILVNAGKPSNTDPNYLKLQGFQLPTNTFKAKSIFVNAPGLSDAGVNAMIKAMNGGPTQKAYFLYDLFGKQSAINQVPRSATSFVHRSSLFTIQAVAYWGNNAGEAAGDTAYINNYYQSVRPYATSEAYQNYIDRDMPLSAYYGSNLGALITDKKKWDPKNVFNFPQSIPLK
ncbi:hypothetical protein KC19_6G056200 [Ceratodon purpureus]|uniref:FAD-binding PCMH-type domain-containing protein n=1 Tax=Ceratodon purpureus TaxID=3225 RepID=A0A8T0HCH5_CERPU|nr:hypothetical protein KC19_6G056200 [Ceratodon purpureus]KAG0568971.1 hypothetical protein KC19_6G056200 [Ceratodon purpureus]